MTIAKTPIKINSLKFNKLTAELYLDALEDGNVLQDDEFYLTPGVNAWIDSLLTGSPTAPFVNITSSSSDWDSNKDRIANLEYVATYGSPIQSISYNGSIITPNNAKNVAIVSDTFSVNNLRVLATNGNIDFTINNIKIGDTILNASNYYYELGTAALGAIETTGIDSDTDTLATTALVKDYVDNNHPIEIISIKRDFYENNSLREDVESIITIEDKSILIDLTDFALLDSPDFAGIPTAPNMAVDGPNLLIANKAYVDESIAGIVGNATANFSTLEGIESKIGLLPEGMLSIVAFINTKATSGTTLANYGITDAKIESGVITLGSNTITPITDISGKVNRLSASNNLRAYTQTASGDDSSEIISKSNVADSIVQRNSNGSINASTMIVSNSYYGTTDPNTANISGTTGMIYFLLYDE